MRLTAAISCASSTCRLWGWTSIDWGFTSPKTEIFPRVPGSGDKIAPPWWRLSSTCILAFWPRAPLWTLPAWTSLPPLLPSASATPSSPSSFLSSLKPGALAIFFLLLGDFFQPIKDHRLHYLNNHHHHCWCIVVLVFPKTPVSFSPSCWKAQTRAGSICQSVSPSPSQFDLYCAHLWVEMIKASK